MPNPILIRPDKVGAPSPCVLGLWLILILISTLAPSRSLANPPVLVAGDGTYLGVVSANEYDPESTSNPFGKKGTRATVGIPGTGMSWSEKIDPPSPKSPTPRFSLFGFILQLIGLVSILLFLGIFLYAFVKTISQ